MQIKKFFEIYFCNSFLYFSDFKGVGFISKKEKAKNNENKKKHQEQKVSLFSKKHKYNEFNYLNTHPYYKPNYSADSSYFYKQIFPVPS